MVLCDKVCFLINDSIDFFIYFFFEISWNELVEFCSKATLRVLMCCFTVVWFSFRFFFLLSSLYDFLINGGKIFFFDFKYGPTKLYDATIFLDNKNLYVLKIIVSWKN